jgi:acetyl esterase/lipase
MTPHADTVPRRWLVVLLIAALAAVAEPVRANDPRPPADAPFGVEPRPSRRAQRRARRRPTLPETAVESDGSASGSAGRATGSSDRDGKPLVHRDQPSREECLPCQRFDLYLPQGCGGRLPLVVWIHGDTWRTGTKDDCPVTWLTAEGYAVASVGYRLSSAAAFPAQVDDCLAALGALERDAEIWGIDRDRICVAGAAAGGHLAALAGLWRETTDDPPPRVAAIGAFAAPSQLTTLGPQHDRAGSPASVLVGGPLPEFREVAQRASPLTHVAPGGPPVLLVHGRADTVVPPDQSIRFDAALRSAGVTSRLVVLDDVGHDLSLARGSAAGKALVEFLADTIGPASSGR